MTVSTVGITKKRVRVIEQKTNHSIEYENDVYVVDTSDPTLVLQTGSSSGVDLTGSNTLSSQANSTTTIASGANSTATIGSGNLSTVNLGTGTNTSTKVGTNASGNSTVIRSRDITLGTTSGNHNIYIGETSTGNTSDAILIGTSTHSNITIGNQQATTNNLYINSRNITTGYRTGGSSDSEVTIQGNNITTKATTNYDLKAQGTVVLVANDSGLNGSGTRTYASLGNAVASLAHVDSSNALQASAYLNSNTATLFGIAEAKLDSDTAAVVESPATSIVGTATLSCSSPSLTIAGTTDATIRSPDISVEYKSSATQGIYGNTIYQVNGYNTTSSQGPSSKAHKGTIDLLAAQVTTNSLNTEITGYSKASQISMSPDSSGNNIYARSASGILLRSNDNQLNTSPGDTSGYYLELKDKAELRKTASDGSLDGSVLVNNLGTAITSEGILGVSVTSGNIITLTSQTNTTIGTVKGNISLDASSNDTTFGTLGMTSTNETYIISENSNAYLKSVTGTAALLYKSSLGIEDEYLSGGASRIYVAPYTAQIVASNANENQVVRTAGFSNNLNSTNAFVANTGFSPFTGLHTFDIQPDSNISIGDAVIAVNRTAMLTTTPNDKRCIGIVCEILGNNKVSVASVGDNECSELKGFKVCNENGAISAGDLLTTSSTAGYLMKQSDDIMRSSTVGKSAVDVVFDDNNQAINVYGFIYCG
jgi:hypothetical protein